MNILKIEEKTRHMNENNRFVRWVTRNTSSKNSMISLLKFISFCLSSLIGLLSINFSETDITNTLFLFAIPITFDLGIEAVLAFKSHHRGIPLVIILTVLFLIYLFLSCLAVAGFFHKLDFADNLLKNKVILTPFILSYAAFYSVEMALLFIKALIVKHKEDKAELAKEIKVVSSPEECSKAVDKC